MRALFDLGPIPGGWSRQYKLANTLIVLLTLGAGVAAGCSKANTSAPPVTPSQNPVAAAATPAPAAQPAPAQPTVVVAANDTQRQLQLLNRALMRWMIKNHRHPQTFDEFATSAGTQIPDPPAGKKYTLNARGFIVLVDNSTQ